MSIFPTHHNTDMQISSARTNEQKYVSPQQIFLSKPFV